MSRVESLRRLLLGQAGHHQEARRMWDRRKQRYTVDKSIGEVIQSDEMHAWRVFECHFVLQEQMLTSVGRRTCLTGEELHSA